MSTPRDLSLFSWHHAHDVAFSSMNSGQLMQTTVADRAIGLLRRDDSIFAFTARCPHAGAPMCDGWLDAKGHIVCPLHKYRFDPATGRNTTGEGYKLFTYPVQVRGDEVWVGIMG